jgi:hypothetical protein
MCLRGGAIGDRNTFAALAQSEEEENDTSEDVVRGPVWQHYLTMKWLAFGLRLLAHHQSLSHKHPNLSLHKTVATEP